MNEKTKKEHREELSFFKYLNQIELPFVIFMQKIFCSNRFYSLYSKISYLGSGKLLSRVCLVLYAIGYYDKSRYLAKCMILYVILTHFKKFFYRTRPNEFPQIHCPKKSGSSSFPSRHCVRATIVGYFLFGEKFHLIFVLLVTFTRLVGGQHYLLDCIAGYFIGILAIYLTRYLNDVMIIVTLASLSFLLWKKAITSFSILPVLLTPKVDVCYLSIFILFIEPLFIRISKKFIDQSPPYKAIFGLFSNALMIFLINFISPYLQNLANQITLEFYYFTSSIN